MIYIEREGKWPGDDRAKYVAKYSVMFDNMCIIHHHSVSVFGSQRSRTSGDYMEVVLNKKTSLEQVFTKKKFSLYFVFLLAASLLSPPPSFLFHLTSDFHYISSNCNCFLSFSSFLCTSLHLSPSDTVCFFSPVLSFLPVNTDPLYTLLPPFSTILQITVCLARFLSSERGRE